MKEKILQFLLKVQMINSLLKCNEWLIVTRKKEEDPAFCHGELSGDTLRRVSGYLKAATDLTILKSSENE